MPNYNIISPKEKMIRAAAIRRLLSFMLLYFGCEYEDVIEPIGMKNGKQFKSTSGVNRQCKIAMAVGAFKLIDSCSTEYIASHLNLHASTVHHYILHYFDDPTVNNAIKQFQLKIYEQLKNKNQNETFVK